jgi:pimeloyl-ACP methyl ester carboxylesterase
MVLAFLIILFFGALAVVSAVLNKSAEKAFPPIGEFVDGDGARLHFISRGEGQAVVLLHGSSGSMRDFELSILDAVADKWRAIAFDRPGHGYSERGPKDSWSPAVQAGHIHAALENLGITTPILVGHSWSGALVTAYALEFPDEVAGVIVLSGATHPWRGESSWFNRLATSSVTGPVFTRTIISPLGRFILGPAIGRNFAPDPVTPAYQAQAGIELLLRPGNFEANAEDSVHLRDFLLSQKARYTSFSPPLTIITGTSDGTVSYKIHAEKLKRDVVHAKLIKLDGVGHMPHHARPGVVLDEIEKLIANLDDSQTSVQAPAQ